MTLEIVDYVKKYRDESLNIGELVKGTKIPKGENGKIPYHNEINTNDLDQDRGLCVYCGITSNHLMIIDLDDATLFEHFKIYQDRTLIVKTGKKGFHLYFRTYNNPKSKSLTNAQGQHIDILGQGKIAVLPPTIHPETNKQYEIISDCKIKQLTTQEEQGLNQKLIDLGFGITEDKKPVSELHKDNFVKTEGTNRGEDLLRVIDSWYAKNRELTESMLFLMANEYNNLHFNPPYPEDKVRALVKQGIDFINNKNEEPKKEEITQTTRDKDLIDTTAIKIKKKYDFVTVRKLNEILMYDGKIYSKSDAESIIKEETEVIIPNCTTHERNEVVNKIKAQTGTDIQEFDNNVKTMTLINGILDFDTLSLSPHTPENLSRVLLPVEYQEPEFKINNETIFADIEKNLKDTLFWKFLKDSFTVVDQRFDDLEFRNEEFQTVLEVIASFFVKHQIDEKAFMFLGRGENGKSVLLEYIESLLGKENKESIPLQLLSNDKFMASKLVGKLANIFSDLESDELRHTGVLKAIISGEGLTVQEKYKEPFTLYPFSKMLFSCNRFPKSYDQGQGFFRRWIIVKWERNFEGDPKRNEHLKDKLKENQEEKNKVFSCLIHLTRKLLGNGKFSHSKDWKTVMEEWNANADPIGDFIDKCIEDSEEDTPVRDVYSRYKHYMASKQEIPLGIAKFGKEFKEVYDQEVKKGDKTTRRVWVGVKLKRIEVNGYN
ncbi:hypothetical protein NMT12_40108 [metagenome]